MENQSKFFEFFQVVGELKELPRAGWLREKEIKNPENVADHCYRTGLLALLFSGDKKLDVNKMMKMGLIHDLAEAKIGDYTPYDKITPEEKRKKEEAAFREITKFLPQALGDEMLNLWLEFEEEKSEEGKIVRQLDILERMMQAQEYEQKYKVKLDSFFTATKSITHPVLLPILEKILSRRKSV